jgi:signal transduction histidine kinase
VLADPTTDAATWREIGEDVLGACIEQERLLEACLTLARTEGGPERREPADLAPIVASALQAQSRSGLQTVVVLEPARTTGDPDLLERLAVNLVSNAARHNVAGGRIELATRTEEGCAVLSVANTGPRVPPTELCRLFQPFQRLGGHRNGGVGLGLAIVQAIADAHHALITARARARGGLDISVAFPALD